MTSRRWIGGAIVIMLGVAAGVLHGSAAVPRVGARLVDGRDGRPIAGAVVQLNTEASSVLALGHPVTVTLDSRWLRTGNDGGFEFPGRSLPVCVTCTGWTTTLLIVAPGHEHFWRHWELSGLPPSILAVVEPLALAREPFASNDRNLDNRCDLFDGRYVRGAVIGRDAAGACAATVDAWRATRSTEAALPRGVVVRAPGARFDRVALTDDAFVARDSRTGLGMAWKNNGQPAPYGDVESLLSRIHDDPRAPCTPRPRRDITPWTLEKLFGERRPVAFEALSSDDVLACAPQIYDVYLSARDGGLHRVRSGFAGKPYDDDGQFRQRVASALGDRRVVDIAAVPGSPFVYVVTGDEFVYRFAPDGVPEERYVE